MLKRGGRGHDPTGVYGTKQGELAVLCRACPIPGVNLPDGWQNAPPETAYVHINAGVPCCVTDLSSASSIGWSYVRMHAFVSKTNYDQARPRIQPLARDSHTLLSMVCIPSI
jgi:hypothetical protein